MLASDFFARYEAYCPKELAMQMIQLVCKLVLSTKTFKRSWSR